MKVTPSRSLSPRPVILITGSRGLAEQLILNLHQAGFQLSVLCRTSVAQHRVNQLAPDSHCFIGDLNRSEVAEAWVAEALRQFGRIDGLVNNAALLGPVGKWHDLNWDEVERTVRVDLLSPLRLIHAALPALLRTEGMVINLSGGGASGPRPYVGSYSLAKCALVRATENLALEYPELRFYAVAPGILPTDMVREIQASDIPELQAERAAATACLQADSGDGQVRTAQLVGWLFAQRPQHLSGCLISARHDPYDRPLAAPHFWKLRRVDEVLFREVP